MEKTRSNFNILKEVKALSDRLDKGDKGQKKLKITSRLRGG